LNTSYHCKLPKTPSGCPADGRILLMSLIILHGSRLPVVRIARIAGQYAKPRSKPTEMVDMEVTETGPNGDQITKTEKKEILSFRGDNVNGYDATDRQPDPDRLLGYVLS
jgi:3-deoxy-7-phosphoheptulonate synthase